MAGIGANFVLIRLLSISFGIGVILLLIFCIIAFNIWYTEKQKVQKMPRIPMSLCDKHGSYPASASLFIDVPQEGKPDLRVELCPVCYYERQKEVIKKCAKTA